MFTNGNLCHPYKGNMALLLGKKVKDKKKKVLSASLASQLPLVQNDPYLK